MKLLFLMAWFYYFNIVTSSSCYWNAGCPYKYFASKSLYNLIRGDIRDSVMNFADCEPISIWMFIRHGKRNPSKNFVRAMKETLFIRDVVVSSYESGNNSMCAQDIDNLHSWVLDNEIFERMNLLSNEGYQEMVGIGRRVKEAFPTLLADLNRDDYTFRSLKEIRIQDSLMGFLEGLSNKNLSSETPKDGFDVAAPFKVCRKYIDGVILNNATFMEVRNYHQSAEYLETKYRIQSRLGINHTLTDENVMAIWNFCRSTSSGILNKFSPWCALLTTEDLMVMEYIEDLKHYYRNGYGISQMAKIFGEIVLSDLLTRFQNAKGTGKKITAYVTDSTILDMVFTALNLFKDAIPLTGKERNPDRKWKTSTISSFSNNIIAVLNRCGKPEDDNYNVAFYLNEEPLAGICKERVCSWKEFEDKFTPFLDANLDFC